MQHHLDEGLCALCRLAHLLFLFLLAYMRHSSYCYARGYHYNLAICKHTHSMCEEQGVCVFWIMRASAHVCVVCCWSGQCVQTHRTRLCVFEPLSSFYCIITLGHMRRYITSRERENEEGHREGICHLGHSPRLISIIVFSFLAKTKFLAYSWRTASYFLD